jgi:hypothetical protein
MENAVTQGCEHLLLMCRLRDSTCVNDGVHECLVASQSVERPGSQTQSRRSDTGWASSSAHRWTRWLNAQPMPVAIATATGGPTTGTIQPLPRRRAPATSRDVGFLRRRSITGIHGTTHRPPSARRRARRRVGPVSWHCRAACGHGWALAGSTATDAKLAQRSASDHRSPNSKSRALRAAPLILLRKAAWTPDRSRLRDLFSHVRVG